MWAPSTKVIQTSTQIRLTIPIAASSVVKTIEKRASIVADLPAQRTAYYVNGGMSGTHILNGNCHHA
jgi:hypothetical protein